jgi:hypothetical protein
VRIVVGADNQAERVIARMELRKMDDDIVQELKAYLKEGRAVPVGLISEIIKRIEFLRLHAGAITEGETFDDITKRTPRGAHQGDDRGRVER